MKSNRRTFIKQSSIASAGTLLVPGFLQQLPAVEAPSKKLIVIQFSGGNDGLNTVIPYRNDLYYQYRPTLGIPSSEVLSLNDQLGLHPAARGLANLMEKGYVSILNSVGYPNPDRSHFRSMDIWHTASGSDEHLHHGWIGRYLDNACHTCSAHSALEMDDSLSLAMKGYKRNGMAVSRPDRLYQVAKSIVLPEEVPSQNEHLHYLYKTMINTTSSAEYLFRKSKIYKSSKSYPSNKFARSLKTVAELIISGSETQVYYVSLGGFDTHIGQAQRQKRLLSTYTEAVEVFVEDLQENNRLDESLILTFSEFGRRVKENASRGTDHGTANNVFLIGGKLAQPGIFNQPADLTDLDNFDLKYQVDFRSIYAAIIDDWLGASSSSILTEEVDRLKLVL